MQSMSMSMKPGHACAALALCLAALAPAAAHALTLEEAVAGDWRPEADTARDDWRNPAGTLEFFGIDPSGAVAEIAPAGGFYARIIGPWVAANGGTYTAVLGSADAADARTRGQMEALEAMIAEAGVAPRIEYGVLSPDAGAAVAPPESQDAIVTFRNVHGWLQRGFAEKAFADFYAALKPGGVLGVVAHRLPEDSDAVDGEPGYARESRVIAMAEAAGFVLEDRSEINANPADTADHPLGVWTLPPTRFSPEAGTPEAEGFDRAAYDAIGESDRMTLRFRKPAL